MKYINIILAFIIYSITKISYAVDGGVFLSGTIDGGVFGNLTIGRKLREGKVSPSDIPGMITYAIDFLMGIAATISVIFIIIGAYKILFGSISQDKTKGRDTILMAIGGFILASLAWFIIKMILDNF